MLTSYRYFILIISYIFLYSITPSSFGSSHFAGATLGEFSVNSNGAANYQINIDVPPGTAGMQPSLSLNYNSSGSNGYLGMGWSLGGLSVITHCPKTLAQDGEVKGVNFSQDDRYCLDGQRLVATTGTYGGNGTEYRTENESYSRIKSIGNLGNSPLYFTVETKAGQIMEYGNTANSRLISGNGNDPLLWAVSKISDTKTNYMNMTYENNSVIGEQYISRIDYAGNVDAGKPTYAYVQFNYENRSDSSLRYMTGTKISMTKRLKSIETHTSGLSGKKYKFAYSYSASTNRSLINSLSECDVINECKLSSTFNSVIGSSGFSVDTWTGLNDWGASSYTWTGDFNGDGLTDIASASGGNIRMRLSTGAGFDSQTWVVPNNWGASSYTWTGDFNGDGLTDIASASGGNIRMRLSTGAGFDSQTWVVPNDWGASSYTWTGDFNGDGLTDIASASGGNIRMRLSTGAGFDSQTWVVPNDWGASSYTWTGDFNGDGLTDIASVSGGNIRMRLSTGAGFDSQTWVVPNNWGASSYTWTGDFNGDGLTDIASASGGNIRMKLSTGISFVTDTWTVPNDWGSSLYTWPGDFNNDGLTDIASASGGNIRMRLSTGAGFNSQTWAVPNQWGHYSFTRIGDYNGDGITDIASVSGANVLMKLNNSNGATDKLGVIVNGLGDKIDITYAPLTDNTIYTKGMGGTYPIMDVQSTNYVVSSYSNTEGYTYQYRYEDLKTHMRGYGNLGFKTLNMIDPQKGVKTITNYRQGLVYNNQGQLVLNGAGDLEAGFPKIDHTQGKVSLIETRFSTGNQRLLESTSASWESTALPSPYDVNKRFIIHKTSTIDETYKLLGGLVSRVTTSYEFENQGTAYDYGNVSRVTQLHHDSHQQVTTNTYNNIISANQWYLGRLATASVTNTTAYGDTATRYSRFEYKQDSGLLSKEVIHVGDPSLQKTTSYSYDAYGNKVSIAVSAPGVTTRSTTIHYDSRGQFPRQTINALLQSETYEYDARWGVKTKLTGPNQLDTIWDYDSLGRQIKETRADGTYTTIEYNLCENGPSCTYGAPLWITKQDYGKTAAQGTGSVPSTIYFDPMGREVRTSTYGFDGREIEKLTRYNAFGQAYKISQEHYVNDSEGSQWRWTEYEFDVLGRMTKESKPDQTYTTISYDGLVTTHTNAKGQRKTEIKDPRGKIIQVTDDYGNSSYYEYDPFGNLVNTLDNEGNLTSLAYDIAGNKISMTDLDMGHWVYGYNGLGELVCQRDANNARANDDNCKDDTNTAQGPFTKFMVYDKLGRMTSRVEKEGTTSWVYDTAAKGIGKLHKSYSPNGTVMTQSYGPYGRPIQTKTEIDAKTFISQITYDPNYNRVVTQTYPSGFAVKNIYNNRGFLIEVQNAANSSKKFWRLNNMLATGEIIEETYGNNVTTNSTYHPFNNRLTGILTGNGGNIQHLTFQYDAVGNLIERKDENGQYIETFEFDQLNRLVESAMGTQINRVNYDSIGNITFKTGVGNYTYHTNSPHAIATAGGASYQYDNNGNLIQGDSRNITYTSFNKPLTIARGSVTNNYTYDAEHARIKKVSVKSGVTTTTYYMGKSYEKVYNQSGVVQQKHYISAGSVTLLYTKSSNTSDKEEYLHKDHLGSTDVMTNVNGAVIERTSFDAWGARRNVNWTDTGNFGIAIISLTTRGFTGHEHDDEIGLINMNARLYDAKLGRFLTPDTFVQFPYSTQGMNRYVYVNNNPISYTDPSGHFVATLTAFVIKVAMKVAIAQVISAAVTAIAGDNTGLAKALNTVISIYMGGNIYESIATNYGGEKVQRIMLVMQFAKTVDSNLGESNRLNTEKLEQVAVDATAGGVNSKLGGGKFANGAKSAALTSMLSEETTKADPSAEDRTSARIAKDVYDPKGKTINGYNLQGPLNIDKESGLQWGRYTHETTGDTIIAFAGTNGGRDWDANISQAFGLEHAQYTKAAQIGSYFKGMHGDNVRFVGHSLGGGLAAAAAIATGGSATIFNAAGINSHTLMGGNPMNASITHYSSSLDVLQFANTMTPVHRFGQQRTLGAAGFHGINGVCKAMGC